MKKVAETIRVRMVKLNQNIEQNQMNHFKEMNEVIQS